MKNNSIINSLKRLERAGSENSRATEKLFEAAREVASLIEEIVPTVAVQGLDVSEERSATLPRGYSVEVIFGNRYLVQGGFDWITSGNWVDGTGTHNDRITIPKATRAGVLQFSADIAGGLLDEISAWLEARKGEAEKASEILENAKL
jgi:hypothetical protein